MTAELVFSALSGTVVNTSVTVAVAAIAEDFDAPVSSVAAVVVLLNVAMAFTMPLSGVASAWLGPRRLLIVAGIAVVGASVMLSLSPNLLVLGVARALQGAALAAVVPVSVQASGQLLSGTRRAKALGWWGAGNGIGLTAAPLLGGILIEAIGWRFVTIPSCLIGLGLIVTAARAFPSSLAHDPGIPFRGVGLVALTAGTGMTALAAASASAWLIAGIAAVAAVVCLFVTRRATSHGGSLAEVRRWSRQREVRLPSYGATMQMMANGLAQVAVPAWLVVNGIVGDGLAGAAITVMTLTMAILAPLTGRARSVPYVRWLRVGLIGCAVGMAVLAAATWQGLTWMVVPALAVLGLGSGCLLAPSLTAFSASEAGHNAVALSLFNLLRLGAFGVGGLVAGAFLDIDGTGAAFGGLALICLVVAFGATWGGPTLTGMTDVAEAESASGAARTGGTTEGRR